jgi:lysophospholipid acyltransferase (LPLAT)-like uncharacterized protein
VGVILVRALLLHAYLALVRWTSSFAVDEFVTLLKARECGHSAVIAVWHRELFLLLLLPCRDRKGLHVLVSSNHGADVYAMLLTHFGIEVLRPTPGSSVRQVLETAAELLRIPGTWIVVAVDGPFGPRRTAKQGVSLLSRRSGLPIVPLHCEARSYWLGSTWDRRVYPRPMNHVLCRVGTPIGTGIPFANGALATVTSAVQRGLESLEASGR